MPTVFSQFENLGTLLDKLRDHSPQTADEANDIANTAYLVSRKIAALLPTISYEVNPVVNQVIIGLRNDLQTIEASFLETSKYFTDISNELDSQEAADRRQHAAEDRRAAVEDAL